MDGMLVEVEAPTRSSHAMQAQSVGAFVVTVEDPTLFAENGGRLDIAGVQYDYTAVDQTTNVISLATSVTVPVALYDPVSVVAGGIVAQDFNAIVDPGDGHNVTVNIPFALRSQFQVGPYNPPLPVKVSDDLTELIEVDGQQPGNMNITDELGNVVWSGTDGPLKVVIFQEDSDDAGSPHPLASTTVTVPAGYTQALVHITANMGMTFTTAATMGVQAFVNSSGSAVISTSIPDAGALSVPASWATLLTGLTAGETITLQGEGYYYGTISGNTDMHVSGFVFFLR